MKGILLPKASPKIKKELVIVERKIITYAIENETGLVWSRMSSEVAIPTVDFESGHPDNNFEMDIKLEKDSVFACTHADLTWTKKIPKEVKNIHRAFWGMKPLK